MANPRPTTAESVLLAGAIITVLASFLDTVGDASAWGRGLSTLKLVPIYAIVVGGVVALRRFARAELPERVGSFTWPHLFVAISFFGTVMALAWLFVPSNPGAGLYAMALGSVVMFVGAVSELRAASRRLHVWSPPPRSGATPTRGDFVALAGGALMLIGSFLAFFELPALSLSFSAWSRDYLFPVTAIPVVCGIVIALAVVGSILNVDLPARFAGFTSDQIVLACSTQAAVMMFVFMVEDNGPLDFGIGFYLMLVAAAALIVGAVMRTREPRTSY